MNRNLCPCGCWKLYDLDAAREHHRTWKEARMAAIYGMPPLEHIERSRQNGKATATNYLTQAANSKAIWDDIATKKGTNVTNKQTSGTNRRAALERAVDLHADESVPLVRVLATADAFYAWLQEEKPAEAPKAEESDAPTTGAWVRCGSAPVRKDRFAANGTAYETYQFRTGDIRFQRYTYTAATAHSAELPVDVYAEKRVTRKGTSGVCIYAEYRLIKKHGVYATPIVIGAFVVQANP